MRAVMTEKQGLSSLMSPAYEQESTDKTGNQDKSSVRLRCLCNVQHHNACTDRQHPTTTTQPRLLASVSVFFDRSLVCFPGV